MKRRTLILLFLGFVVVAAGIAAYSYVRQGLNLVDTVRTDVGQINAGQAEVNLQVGMFNPLFFDVYIDSVIYRFAMAQDTLIDQKIPVNERLESLDTIWVDLPVTYPYARFIDKLKALEDQDSTDIYNFVKAGYQVGFIESKLTVDRTTKIPVPHIPELSLEGIEVNDLGLEEADLTLKIKIGNKSEYDLQLDSLNYTVQLEDKPLVSNARHVQINLQPHQTEEIALPLKLKVENLNPVRNLLKALTDKNGVEYTLHGYSVVSSSKLPIEGLTFVFQKNGSL